MVSSYRRGGWVIVLALLVVNLVLGPAGGAVPAASAQTAPVEMQYACISSTGPTVYVMPTISYVTPTGSCGFGQTKVALSATSPILACAPNVYVSVVQVATASQCTAQGPTASLLPLPTTAGPTYFCVTTIVNTLRYVTSPTACTPGSEFAVVVSQANQPPVARADGPYTTAEDTALTVSAPGVLGNDSDPDAGDTLSAVLVTGPSHGTLSLGTNGSFTYTPAANYNGSDSFTYKARDSKGALSTAAATVSLTVTPVNDAPTATSQSVTATEDTAKTITLAASDVDGNALSFSIVSQPSHGTLGAVGTPSCTAGACTASVTYTPAANYNGSDSFTFKVSDGTLSSGNATVSITVTAVNDAPVADSQSVGTLEDTAKTITLSASDVDGDTLSFSIVTGPTHGTLGTIGTPNCSAGVCTATVTYTPAANYHGTDSFTFRVKDSTLFSTTATVSLTVDSVNDAPVAANQSVTTPEDTAKTVTLSASDADADALTFSIVTGPSHGTLGTIGSPSCTAGVCTATVTYTPAANYNGADSFTFKTTDGTADSNTGTVSLTVTPVNDAPVAVDDSYNTNGASPFTTTAATGVLHNDTDVDGDSLTAHVVSGPSHGTLTLNADGSFSYTPTAGASSDSFTYKANDGTADSNVATVTISINTPPVAQSQSVTTTEDTAKTITLTGTDADDDALTFSIVTGPAHGTLGTIGSVTCSTTDTSCSATVSYTPNANSNGSDSFTFRVNDGHSNSPVATVSLTITPVNDAPVADSQSVTTNEDTAKTITLGGSDVDGNALTFSLVQGPSHGTLGTIGTPSCTAGVCTATVTYTPAANYNGSDSFTFKTNDGTVDSTTGTVSLTVTPVNDAPTVSDQSVTTAEDTAKTITLSGSDVDADPLSFSITSPPAHGTLSTLGAPSCSAGACTASVTYTPAANYNGSDSFTYRVNDGTVNSSTATVSLTVTAVNDAPVAEAQSVTTTEDTAKTVTLRGSDVDGNALTFSLGTGPSHGTLSPISTPSCSAGVCTADVTYTPTANYNGSDSFTFKVNDGTVDSSTATVSLTVTAVNDAPTASDQTVTTAEDTAKTITLSGSDADADVLSFSITAGPTHGTLSPLGLPDCSLGMTCTVPVTYTPAANYNGNDSFTYTVSDGTVSVTATVSITVTAVNDAPVAEAQSVTTNEDTAKTITLRGSDVESGNLPFSIVSGPSHGTLGTVGTPSCSAGVCTADVTYTPNANYNGADSFTFKVNDGTVDSNTATVSVTVTPVNDAPTVSDQSVTTAEDTAKIITLSGSDVDADPLSFSITAPPSHGTLSSPGLPSCSLGITCTASVTYTPAANYNGSDSFTYTVSDGTVGVTATVSITVTAVNDAPVAESQSVTTNEDTATTVTLRGSDVDGGTLTFALVGSPSHGTLSPIGTPSCTAGVCTATVTYTPNANYNGSDSFTFKVNDGTVDSTNGLVSVTVTPVNDAPTVSDQSVTTPEDTAKTVSLAASDVDGDTLSYSIVAQPAHGTLSAIGTPSCAAGVCTASVTYTPAANYNGSDVFTYKVNDGTVDSTTGTISFTVTPVNDAPVLGNLEGTALAFTEGDSPTAITSSITVSDVDNTQLTGATVLIGTGYQSGQDVLAYTAPGGNPVTGLFSAATGVLTLSGAGTLAQYQAALRAVTFGNTSENPSTATRTITFQVNDGQGANNLSATVSRQITVTAVNDAPVNTVPAAQTVNEDTNLTFSTGNTNRISIGDVDAGSSTVKVSLDVAHGTLTLPSTTGLTFVDGTGNGSGSVHVTGTITAINTALDGLVYRGTQNYNVTRGAESLTVVTNDQGNTGTPGPLSDTDTVGITVTAVNDAPTAQAKSFTVQANMKITGLTGLLSGASDPDTGDGGYTASFTVGTVSATSPAGGTISNLNSSTGTFDFDPPPGATGNVTFTYTVCDSGNPAPSACSAAATVTVSVSGPVIWFVNPAVAGPGDGRLSNPFKFLSGNSGAGNDADDVDAASQRVFVYTGTASGGITLNASEWLIGQGVSGTDFDTLMGLTGGSAVPTGTIARPSINGTRPSITGLVTMGGSSTVRGLNITPASGTGGLSASGATGLTVGEVSVTTTNATGVSLTNSDGTFSFTSVSTDRGTNGILWNNASPATGSLTVTGDGSTANSGGTIQHTAGPGGAAPGHPSGQNGNGAIQLKNARNVSLSFMKIFAPNGNGFQAVDLQGTGNLIQKSVVDYNNTVIANAYALRWESYGTSADATLTLDGTTFQNKGDGTTAVSLSAMGAATNGSKLTLNVQDSNTGDAFPSKYTNLFGSGIVVGSGDITGSTAHVVANVSNTTFIHAWPTDATGNPTTGGLNDLEFGVAQSAVLDLQVINNTFDDIARPLAQVGVINVNSNDTGQLGSAGNPARIAGNTIQNIGIKNASFTGGYIGMRFGLQSSSATTHRLVIANNQLLNLINTGILLSARDKAVVNARIDNTSGPGNPNSVGNTIGTVAAPVGQNNRPAINVDASDTGTENLVVQSNPSIVGVGSSSANSAVSFTSGVANNITSPAANFNATVVSNTIGNTNAAAGTAGRFRARTLAPSGGTNTSNFCLDLRSNGLEDSSKLFQLVHASTGTFARNASGNTGTVSETGSFTSAASCPQPSL